MEGCEYTIMIVWVDEIVFIKAKWNADDADCAD